MESKKNAHRLNRIFRKPKTMVAPRSWREEPQNNETENNNNNNNNTNEEEIKRNENKIGPFDGVPLAYINSLTEELTSDDKIRAAAAQEPPSAVQEELAKRAARFGLPIANINNNNIINSNNITVEMDAATLQSREARFKTQEQIELEAAMQRRMARFGTAT